MNHTRQFAGTSIEDWLDTDNDPSVLPDNNLLDVNILLDSDMSPEAPAGLLALGEGNRMERGGRGERAEAEASNSKQEQDSEIADLQLTRQLFSSSQHREIYGSNEDVYNPYNPLASKEYIAQEITAGRMKLERVPQRSSQSAQSSHKLKTPSLRPMRIRREVDETAASSVDETAAWMASFRGTMGHESFPFLESRRAPRGPVSDAAALQSPHSVANSHRRVQLGYSHPSVADELDGYEAGAESDTDTQSQSESDASSRPWRARNPERTRTLRAALRLAVSNPSLPVTGAKRTGSLSALGQVQARLVDRKRRRAERSPQDAVPPPPVPGVIGDHPQRAGTAIRRASTSTPGQQPRWKLRAEASVFVPRAIAPPVVPRPVSAYCWLAYNGLRVELPLDLPQSIRLNIQKYLYPHSATTSPTTRRTPTSSLLPSLRYLRTRHLVFTSELIPHSFDAEKRLRVLHVFRSQAPYVPACISMALNGPNIQYHVSHEAPGHLYPSRPYEAPLGPNGVGWPPNALATETFQKIASFLPRKSLENMRTLNREFEKKISNVQFNNVVVPFRSEIYGMILHEGKAPIGIVDTKGKGKEREAPPEQDATVQTVHDGMMVFKAWGPHMKKFAMTFEVAEDQFAKPPVKGKYEEYKAFWGPYLWPHPYYHRFEWIAGLERKADEFRCMSAALSNLPEVRELGLSIDSGLGWIAGPDISDRARLFQDQPKVFGRTPAQLEAENEDRKAIWRGIVRSLGPQDGSDYRISGDSLYHGQSLMTIPPLGFHQANVYYQPEIMRRTYVSFQRNPADTIRPLVFEGINLSNAFPDDTAYSNINLRDLSHGSKDTPFSTALVVPNKLTGPQKEWLMETEWAQRAFLSSYCMAVIDNSHTFQHVHSLNIAKLSSKHLAALKRDDFWNALANLETLTIRVSADFRSIYKNDSGVVESDDMQPSDAAWQFYGLLKKCITGVAKIKNLTLGYCGGGERQTGIFGRNKSILPAPLADYSDRQAFGQDYRQVLIFPYVEHFTLTNCWIAPSTLKTFVRTMRGANMRTLTLDYVSLTAHSGIADPTEPDPLENGVYRSPRGPARELGDPKIGNFFCQRPIGSYPDPGVNDHWMYTGHRIGSWANVLDEISPGPTRDLIRYAFQYSNDFPELRDPGLLERINFFSCGYVRLVGQPFDQSCLLQVTNCPPMSLKKRAMDLIPVMMQRNEDQLLGQIVPVLSNFEMHIFETAFPMSTSLQAWGDDDSKWDCCEDGQPVGGSGRFTGHLEKLDFANED